MALASAIGLLLKRDRSDFAALALLTLLIAFTAFVGAAGLRLFERTADAAIRRDVAEAPVTQRTIQLAATRTPFGADTQRTMTEWRQEQEQLRSSFPEPLGGLVGDASLAIDSMRFRVFNPPDYPMFISVHYVDGLPDLAELTDGRWPESTSQQLPPVAQFATTSGGAQGRPRATNHSTDPPRRFEVALQASTARSLGLDVGYVLDLAVDARDTVLTSSVLGAIDVRLAPTELEVVGLYRLHDAESDAWFGDQSLIFDDLGLARDEPVADINAYVSPDALPGLITSGLPFEYRWRFPVEVDQLDANAMPQTQEALRIFASRPPGTGASGDVTAEAALLPLLERNATLRQASEAVLMLASSAPLALATGAIAMAAVLLAGRRRAALVLARGRGALPRTLFAATLLEAVVAAVIGATAGLALAIALEPGAELTPSLVAALSIGLLGVIILVGASWAPISQPLADLERAGRITRGSDPRRLVLELVVVVLAAGGAYLLRQRGLGAQTFDPFLAAVPALIALAVGIIAVRLYRPVMAFAGWIAERGRGLVPAFGFRSVARGGASGLPVMVLLLAVAFAAFMSVVLTSVDQAQRTASWATIGADARLDRANNRVALPPVAAIAAVPGVEATARGFTDPRVRAPTGTGASAMSFHALDPVAHATVVEGSPVDPRWPQGFVAEPTLEAPIPVILGSQMTGGNLKLRQGSIFHHTLLGRQLQLQVAEVRSGVPGVTTDAAFMIVPIAWMEHVIERDIEPTLHWIRISEAALPALREQTGADEGTVRIQSRYDELAAMRNDPLVGVVSGGFAVALGVSVAFAVLTILGAVVLSASHRTRDFAILRTLGLDSGQQTRLTLLEHAPPILVALPIGLTLGMVVTFAVTPALNLGALSRSAGAIPLAIDWTTLVALAVFVAVVALLAVVLGTWLSRRARIINALRITSD